MPLTSTDLLVMLVGAVAALAVHLLLRVGGNDPRRDRVRM